MYKFNEKTKKEIFTILFNILLVVTAFSFGYIYSDNDCYNKCKKAIMKSDQIIFINNSIYSNKFVKENLLLNDEFDNLKINIS